MHLIDATNAEAYLRDTGRILPGERVAIRELAGGVSNIVLLVEFPNSDREPFVLKQAREQLRVAQPWFCSPERIWREVEVLRLCEQALVGESFVYWNGESYAEWQLTTPRVLFEDRDHYLFGMHSASSDAVTWKSELLRLNWNPGLGAACGKLLAKLHTFSWQHPELLWPLDDRRYFYDLRVDPYYYEIARRHPSLQHKIDKLVSSMEQTQNALVHGDFSPKNLLVSKSQVMLIDCEVGHWGDPAFDLAFVLSHLVLKTIHCYGQARCHRMIADAFWERYCQDCGLTSEEVMRRLSAQTYYHLRACVLARVDGKSPVEYLTQQQRCLVRELALHWFNHPPPESLSETFSQAVAWSRGNGELID